MDGFSPHIALFHGQQAVEKLFKAWLFAVGIEAPKTHSFTKLTALLELNGCVVPEVGNSVEKLSDFAVQYRYYDLPEEGSPDLPAIRAAVRELREYVLERVAEAHRK
jgi:HEPN domain-containing protein